MCWHNYRIFLNVYTLFIYYMFITNFLCVCYICGIALYPQASSEGFVVCENLVLVPDPIPEDEVWG